MTNLEKAEAWMQMNEIDYDIYDGKVFVSVWNATLQDSFDLQIAKEELREMALYMDNLKLVKEA